MSKDGDSSESGQSAADAASGSGFESSGQETSKGRFNSDNESTTIKKTGKKSSDTEE